MILVLNTFKKNKNNDLYMCKIILALLKKI
jgi:hypothetical protein